MATLSGIPLEVLEQILTELDPTDVSSVAQVSRHFRSVIYLTPDQHLFRSLFLRTFDDPRRLLPLPLSEQHRDLIESFEWRKELQRRISAQKDVEAGIFLSETMPRRFFEELKRREAVLETLVSIASTATPYDVRYSKNMTWLSDLLETYDIFKSFSHGTSDFEISLKSQLHVFKGISPVLLKVPFTPDAVAIRLAARTKVYNLKCYTPSTLYGPFYVDEGRVTVNYAHMHSLLAVLSFNMSDRLDALAWDWESAKNSGGAPPVGFEAIRAYSAPGLKHLVMPGVQLPKQGEDWDWAGVGGKWRRQVMFMDYRDLFAFNFASPTLSPAIFEDDDFSEALRTIELELWVKSYSREPNQSLPTIHYEGKSKGGVSNEALVRGSVRMTDDGHIRWDSISNYDGADHWCSIGVQIGAVGSAAGVLGVWTGARHEGGDPAGPFWFWKVG